VTDKVRFHCSPEQIVLFAGLFARLYREQLYGAAWEDYFQTLRDIARRCRVRASTVEDWIVGTRRPTDQHLEVLIDLAVEEGFSDKLAVMIELWGKPRKELASRGPAGRAIWRLRSWIGSFGRKVYVKETKRVTIGNANEGTVQEGTPIPIQED